MRPPDPTLLLLIGQISERVTRLERRVARIARQVSDLWMWGKRTAIIAGVWIAGVYTNAAPEDKAQLIASLISALGG